MYGYVITRKKYICLNKKILVWFYSTLLLCGLLDFFFKKKYC